MRAEVGDRILIPGRAIDEPVRDGEIVEVHGHDGQPPYLVRWSEDGHLGLFFPGPDAQIQHFAHAVGADGARHQINMSEAVRWARTHGHVVSGERVPQDALDAYLSSHAAAK